MSEKDIPASKRIRFNEETGARLTTFAEELFAAVPEVEGIGVAVIYADDLKDAPGGFLLHRDGAGPRAMLASLEPLTKLQLSIYQQLAQIAAAVTTRLGAEKKAEDAKNENGSPGPQKNDAPVGGSPDTSSAV